MFWCFWFFFVTWVFGESNEIFASWEVCLASKDIVIILSIIRILNLVREF